MSSTLEKVARAICREAGRDPDKVYSQKPVRLCWDIYSAQAIVAIKALRSLPDEVAESLKWHFDNDMVYGQASSVKFLWREAIDAILNDEPATP